MSDPIESALFPGQLCTTGIVYCAVTAMLVCAGCSAQERELGQIAGRVTLHGEPIQTGCVVFENLALGVSQVANLSADGTYRMTTPNGPGILPGTYRVAVQPDPMGTGETPLATDPSRGSQPKPTDIPAIYQHAALSPLRCEVHAGVNPAADFDLPNPNHKSDGPRD